MATVYLIELVTLKLKKGIAKSKQIIMKMSFGLLF